MEKWHVPKFRHRSRAGFLGTYKNIVTFPKIGTDEACVYLGTREIIGTFLDIGT